MSICEVCGTPTTRKCPTCRDKLGVDDSYNPFPTYKFTGKLRPVYPLSPTRTVPAHIKRPDYAETGNPLSEQRNRNTTQIDVLSPAEIEKMREICRISREVLEEAAKAIKVGVTTDEIDRVVHEACIERDCYPSPLNYYAFPKSCCTSLNEVICHGIPDRTPLSSGDILNIDVSCFSRSGFHGDLNAIYAVGDVDPTGMRLIETTRQCLDLAIGMVKPGALYRDLGGVIEKEATKEGFSV
ncbi:hypothetical protein HK101_004113, partial [Irineochytrium annulatum]